MKQDVKTLAETESITDTTVSKYINLMSDYGLKSVLKSEELAIEFLNDVLNGAVHIQKITFLDKEIMPKYQYQRTAIFDLLCEDEHNREFIIEIQRVHQEFFIDRSVFYASAHIQNGAPKGKKARTEWNYQQKPLIFIGLLDFELPKTPADKFKHIGQLCDIEEKTILFDKLTFIFLELPKFAKAEIANSLQELSSLGKWLYAIKNLHIIKEAPDFLRQGVFNKVLEIAEVANMTKEQRIDYERSLKQMRDEYAIKKTAYEEGVEKGVEKTEARKNIEFINRLLSKETIPVSEIAELVGVDEAYVLEIKNAKT